MGGLLATTPYCVHDGGPAGFSDGSRAAVAALRPLGCGAGGLDRRGRRAYIVSVRLRTMVINGAWNNRCGPGGSARRLHQFPRLVRWDNGGETGSTRVVKTHLLPGMIPPLSGQPTSAND